MKVVTLAILSVLAILVAVAAVTVPQQSEATGCPTNFVAEHINNAREAIHSGDSAKAIDELDLADEAIGMANEESE